MRYIIKVRATENQQVTYLWGGSGITLPFESKAQLFLIFRVDEMGEPIIVTTTPSQSIGTLQPGETYSILLNGLTGVSAICIPSNRDSKVECFMDFTTNAN